ncbi:MAG TPA: cupin domain-containing protein [Marmoricola sp.]|nr:cupin domain-containing protein [Marmoricola sp.]
MSDADTSAEAQVTCVRPGDRRVADPTPGKTREQAIEIAGLWSGMVRTEPGVASGWHHHGEHDTSVYVIDGSVRIEFGPGGAHFVEAGPGDFVHIPRHLVHREVNTGSTASQEVITRSGTGPVTVNVDGPAPPA